MYPLPPDNFLFGFHLAVTGFSVLVFVSCATLFSVAHISERALRTSWRAWGFWLLAVAFAIWLFTGGRPEALLLALAIELIGQSLIAQGVLREPLLSPLRRLPTWQERLEEAPMPAPTLLPTSPLFKFGLPLAVLGVVTTTAIIQRSLLPYALLLSTIVVLLGVIVVQIMRYRVEDGSSDIHRHNLFPLLAYLLLVIRAGVLILDGRSPNPLILAIASALLLPATLLLGRWAWLFIRIRPQLRTLIVFIIVLAIGGTLAVFATAGAFLVFLQTLVTP